MNGIFLTGGTTSIDTGLLTEVVDASKSLLGLLKEFPMNLMVIGLVVSIAIGVIVKVRKVAR